MRPRAARSIEGFSLVEVVLALGVTIFCLIALFGLLSVGLRSNRTTIEQTGATAILSAVSADLYATPQTSPPGAAATSLQFKIGIPANPVTSATPVTTLYFPANGALSTNASPANSAFRLTVTPVIPGGSNNGTRTATFLDLTVSWPAAATTANAAGTVETFVSLNRN
jgi:uncharacterized protein (TIGR02598 family)